MARLPRRTHRLNRPQPAARAPVTRADAPPAVAGGWPVPPVEYRWNAPRHDDAGPGVVLSVTTRWGLVRHWWVVAKEAITIAVIATDVLVVWPAMDRAVDAGTPAGIPGPIVAHCVVLALATGLSIVKPKARTRSPRHRRDRRTRSQKRPPK